MELDSRNRYLCIDNRDSFLLLCLIKNKIIPAWNNVNGSFLGDLYKVLGFRLKNLIKKL